MSIELIDFWFKHRLSNTGYGDCKTRWSLSSGQGDGVVWHGSPDVHQLIRRHLPDRKFQEAASRAVEKGFELIIVDADPRMRSCSANSMWLDRDALESDREEWTPFERMALELLVDQVEAELPRLSLELEQEGYSLLEVGGDPDMEEELQRYEVAGFVVTLTKLHEPDFSFDFWDKDAALDFCRQLIAGQAEYFQLRLTVEHEHEVLAVQHLGSIVDDKNGSYWKELGESMAKEALAEARKKLQAKTVGQAA